MKVLSNHIGQLEAFIKCFYREPRSCTLWKWKVEQVLFRTLLTTLQFVASTSHNINDITARKQVQLIPPLHGGLKGHATVGDASSRGENGPRRSREKGFRAGVSLLIMTLHLGPRSSGENWHFRSCCCCRRRSGSVTTSPRNCQFHAPTPGGRDHRALKVVGIKRPQRNKHSFQAGRGKHALGKQHKRSTNECSAPTARKPGVQQHKSAVAAAPMSGVRRV